MSGHSNDTLSQFRMVDVGSKDVTSRRAVASGYLKMGVDAFALLRAGRLPKGDALKLGEVAGILAAKKTPENIPLCHPLPLDAVTIRFELDPRLPGVRAFCEASATAKTGVEMEALSGVTGALLCVYDLVKQVDPALTISDIRLEMKLGGKSGEWTHPESGKAPHLAFGHPLPSGEGDTKRSPLPTGEGRVRGKAVVVTVSDRCFRGQAEDKSGPVLREGLSILGLEVATPIVVPDEKDRITQVLLAAAKVADVIVLTGGTGLSPRDVTPEAVQSVCDRMIPGIGEALRAAGAGATPMSPLSRSVAGQLGRTLVVALPGSTGGAKDGLEVLAPLLPHALHIMKGGAH